MQISLQFDEFFLKKFYIRVNPELVGTPSKCTKLIIINLTGKFCDGNAPSFSFLSMKSESKKWDLQILELFVTLSSAKFNNLNHFSLCSSFLNFGTADVTLVVCLLQATHLYFLSDILSLCHFFIFVIVLILTCVVHVTVHVVTQLTL